MAPTLAKLLTALSVISAVLVRPGSTQFLPPPQQPTECWSTLTTVPNCAMELYVALFNGQFGVVGPACCHVITKITDLCWSRMFPLNPLFPPLLKNSCSAAAAPSPPQDAAGKCWAPFGGVGNCVWDIYRALFRVPPGGSIGPECCKVVRGTAESCWSVMFPANPFYPMVLRNSCPSGGPLLPNVYD